MGIKLVGAVRERKSRRWIFSKVFFFIHKTANTHSPLADRFWCAYDDFDVMRTQTFNKICQYEYNFSVENPNPFAYCLILHSVFTEKLCVFAPTVPYINEICLK